MFDLEGSVVVVTGAASGIGRAAAELYGECGATVVLADLNVEGAGVVASEIVERGGTALAVSTDVSDEPAVEAMIGSAVEAFGTVDILVNCAALTAKDYMQRDKTLPEMDLEVWDRVLAVDLTGVMLCCKHALKVMVANGSGSIVNLSSGHSLVGQLDHSAYGAAKAAVNSLTRYVATQHGKQGIRCNTIVPGATRTPALLTNISPQEIDVLVENVLTQDLGRPLDIARAIVFVSSPWAGYITGEAINVTGGRTAHTSAYAQQRRLAADHV